MHIPLCILKRIPLCIYLCNSLMLSLCTFSLCRYASASRDLNPIHRSVYLAAFADLPKPIVHGMWTAGYARSAGPAPSTEPKR